MALLNLLMFNIIIFQVSILGTEHNIYHQNAWIVGNFSTNVKKGSKEVRVCF